MLSLNEKQPYVYHQFQNNGFVVQKTSRRFSSIAVDQAHEQNNALVKRDEGAVGLTENPGALRRWMISGPEIARMITEFEDDTALITEEKTDQANHHEERQGVQISFAKDVKALVSVMEEMGNLFLEESTDLLVLDTRTIADASVVATVRQIVAVGKDQLDTYFKECLTEEKRSIYDPIKKNKFKLFSSPPPKIPSKDKEQIAMLKSDCALFSRLYIACQTRDGDLDEFFEHENQGCPPSLSQHGSLRLPGNKSDLLQCIEAVIPAPIDSPNSTDVTIIYGAAAINMLKPTPAVKTFHDYAEQVFIPYVKGQLQHAKRVDVVWDEYTPNSLKETTRKKRGRGIRRRVLSPTKLRNNWHEFLRVNENKTELFAFLANHILSADFGSNKQVITTLGQQVLCNPPRDDINSLAPCNHEEADTRMMVHVADAVQGGLTKVLLRTVDTDVVVIAIAVSQTLSTSELWIAFGVGKNLRFLPVHEIASSLGPEKSKALPMFHAITGCDTVSSFSGKGKKTAWKTWLSYHEVTSAFHLLSDRPESVTDECMDILERFIVLLYDRTCPKMKVNEARKILFTQKGRSHELIPPTRAALVQHVKRAVYQGGYCWGQVTTPMAVLPSPSEWGWLQTADGWKPFWSTLSDVSTMCNALICCGCKKGCRGNCSCRKAALQCTALCVCDGECIRE